MSGDDYEAIKRFFITVTKQDAPALSAQYGFAEAAMCNNFPMSSRVLLM